MQPPLPVIDAHVHVWDPAAISYPWLATQPRLNRPFALEDLDGSAEGVPLDGFILVEGDAARDAAGDETAFLSQVAAADSRVRGIIARADPTAPDAFGRLLDRYERMEKVRGIRQNIQGNSAGYCLSESFVDGVREAGHRGLTFDLCATHDQLEEVQELAERCPGTRLVLDHCGKPDIARQRMRPWRERIGALAELPHLWCKLSGLLTEADPSGWRDEDLLPYADAVAEEFGPERLIYGGDWPVLSLAGTYHEWYLFTRRFTRDWGAEGQSSFYRDNALRFYGIAPPEDDGRR